MYFLGNFQKYHFENSLWELLDPCQKVRLWKQQQACHRGESVESPAAESCEQRRQQERDQADRGGTQEAGVHMDLTACGHQSGEYDAEDNQMYRHGALNQAAVSVLSEIRRAGRRRRGIRV